MKVLDRTFSNGATIAWAHYECDCGRKVNVRIGRFKPVREVPVMMHQNRPVATLSPKKKCYYCLVFLTPYDPARSKQYQTARTIDHVIPLSKGGPDIKRNRVAACYRCNQGKADKMLWHAIKHLGLIEFVTRPT